MPTGYAGEGKTFIKSLGKWVTKKKERVFDYDALNSDAMAFLVSFFRYFPDYWYDIMRAEDAKYELAFIQRLMLRINANFRNVYMTGARGATKTFVANMSETHDGEFFPGEIARYCAPAQVQSAVLASAAFKAVCRDYPYKKDIWDVHNDRIDMFRISTMYGSEFTMYAPRGDNCSAIVGEEMGQEGKDGFNIEDFSANISPTCRLDRTVNRKPDRCHIDQKRHYIGNACSRTNKAYTVYRKGALDAMLYGKKYAGYCIDIPWIAVLVFNVRSVAYYEAEKSELAPETWAREMEALYTGTGVDPMIPEETLSKARRLPVIETSHCGDKNAIYIIAHDVSISDAPNNAKCSDVVMKLSEYEGVNRRDIYRKQIVDLDNYPPFTDAREQAIKIKRLWASYCLDGGNPTYIVIDAQSYGMAVVQELMKPLDDGLPCLCCYNHIACPELEQEGALPVIYPLKAGGRGYRDEDGLMIEYAQLQFWKGYIELPVANVLEGLRAFKKYHNIKDDLSDAKIARAYRVADELCQQISNLQAVASGTTKKEIRKSKAIQRDIWSALKYALRFAQILENLLVKEKYRPHEQNEAFEIPDFLTKGKTAGERGRLLGLRKR